MASTAQKLEKAVKEADEGAERDAADENAERYAAAATNLVGEEVEV